MRYVDKTHSKVPTFFGEIALLMQKISLYQSLTNFKLLNELF